MTVHGGCPGHYQWRQLRAPVLAAQGVVDHENIHHLPFLVRILWRYGDRPKLCNLYIEQYGRSPDLFPWCMHILPFCHVHTLHKILDGMKHLSQLLLLLLFSLGSILGEKK